MCSETSPPSLHLTTQNMVFTSLLSSLKLTFLKENKKKTDKHLFELFSDTDQGWVGNS